MNTADCTNGIRALPERIARRFSLKAGLKAGRLSCLLFLFCGAWLVRPLAAKIMVDGSVTTNGDINGDGYFDVFDILQLERIVIMNLTPTANEVKAADVDGDGKLTAYDLLVLNSSLGKVNKGTAMFDAVKTTIEDDLSKSKDNVETYLDLARFYRKEGLLDRSVSVLESIKEAMDTNHPLYNKVENLLNGVKDQQLSLATADQDTVQEALYKDTDDLTGKVSLRRQVVQLKGRLSDLMKDKAFAAHYNNKRVQSKLGDVMNDMLRTIGEDKMVDPESFSKFNNDVRQVMDDPENLVKDLNDDQKIRLDNIVNQSTASMQQDAIRLKQEQAAREQQAGQMAMQRQGTPETGNELLNRSDWRMQQSIRGQNNLEVDQMVVANPPQISPDTISLVVPNYTLKWDATNVLGAKNASLEISKANRKFANPRGTSQDKDNDMYYAPSLGNVVGERKGSALELEGVGVYQYRIAALNTKGDFISRFSDVSQLVVVLNNLNLIANKPIIEPKHLSTIHPDYTFRWDLSNIEGAKDVAVEVSKPNTLFSNPNGRDRDRANTFFFNPSLGKLSGTFTSNIDGLKGPGQYLFRVIAVSALQGFIGQWSDPEILQVTEGEVEQPAPKPVAQPAEPVIPRSPVIEPSGSGYSASWDVSQIKGASGVKLEIASSAAGNGNDSTMIPGPVIYSQRIDSLRGTLKIDPGKLQRPGNYGLRIAASDTLGNLLSSWSKPAPLTLNEPAADDTLARRVMAEAVKRDSTEDLPAGQPGDTLQPVQPPPEGKKLVVSSINTPLYSDSNPSSAELYSLKKGESLIFVRNSSDRLWQYVFYPAGGKYGWVFAFNVKGE